MDTLKTTNSPFNSYEEIKYGFGGIVNVYYYELCFTVQSLIEPEKDHLRMDKGQKRSVTVGSVRLDSETVLGSPKSTIGNEKL